MAEIVNFPLSELNIEGYKLTDDEKDRIVLALQGKAVKNPCQEDIDLLRESVATTEGNVSSFTQFDDVQKNQITKTLSDLSTAITNLETHTNIVSGVTINYTGFPPNFLGRLSIANSYNQSREALRKTEGGPCGVEEDRVEIYSRMFRSILGFAEQELEDIKTYLDDIDPNTIEYEDMNTYLNTAISNLNDFETQDDQAYFEAYNFVNKISIAQALINSRNDDFSKRLFDRVIGTQIFNTDDISPLKIQCQVWGADTSAPSSDFSRNFASEFALTSIASSLDVDFEGWTAGYVLKFNSSGTLYPDEDLTGSGGGMTTTGSYFITGTWQFDNMSFSVGSLTGRHTIQTDSTSGKIVNIPDVDNGYFSIANTSGIGVTDGMSFVMTSSGMGHYKFLELDDLENVSGAASANNNDVLAWNSSQQRYVPTTISVPEVNDLTAAVVWTNVPDANITESSVTQHEGALSITESQITDLGSYYEEGDTILAAAGTVSAPGFAFTGDTDTGVFRIASNNLGIAVGGREVFDSVYNGFFTITNFNSDFCLFSATTSWIATAPTASFANSNSSEPAEIAIREASTNGTNQIELTVPASIASDKSWTLPASGVANGVWKDDGSGVITCELVDYREVENTPKQTKSITFENPTSSEDISIFYTTEAITISQMTCVLLGSSSPSVTWTVRHGSDRSAAGNEVVTSGTTTTNTTTGDVVTVFDDATIPANSFVWLETTAQSGTVTQFNLTLEYDVD